MLLCRSNCITVMSYYKAVKKNQKSDIGPLLLSLILSQIWHKMDFYFYFFWNIWIWKLKWRREFSVILTVFFNDVTNTAYTCFTSLACIFFKQLKR